ncbi:MAG: hypothetical protein IIB45_08625 [Candidatus Marinimicrobia bacterium]|nr:hypothetical protein [Candidatus Neomarinimicrobiota bacterium]
MDEKLLFAIISACAAIMGAIIGATGSYFITIKNIRSTIISASRQQWIITLRDVLSEIISIFYTLSYRSVKNNIPEKERLPIIKKLTLVDTHGQSPWHFSKQFKLRLT